MHLFFWIMYGKCVTNLQTAAKIQSQKKKFIYSRRYNLSVSFIAFNSFFYKMIFLTMENVFMSHVSTHSCTVPLWRHSNDCFSDDFHAVKWTISTWLVPLHSILIVTSKLANLHSIILSALLIFFTFSIFIYSEVQWSETINIVRLS